MSQCVIYFFQIIQIQHETGRWFGNIPVYSQYFLTFVFIGKSCCQINIGLLTEFAVILGETQSLPVRKYIISKQDNDQCKHYAQNQDYQDHIYHFCKP